MRELDFDYIGQRIKEVRTDKHLTQEYLANRLKDKDGEPVSVRTIIRLMNELKKYGWLCIEKQALRNKETGEVKTIAEYVLFWQSASAPKSNKELLEEQAEELAKEQAELETEYEGYQASIGDGFDNLQAELEAQQAAGAIAPIPIVEDVQEQTLEVVAEPSELDRAIAFVEQRTGIVFSEGQKQAIARNYTVDEAGTISLLQDMIRRELKAKQG